MIINNYSFTRINLLPGMCEENQNTNALIIHQGGALLIPSLLPSYYKIGIEFMVKTDYLSYLLI